jgi:[ribosomal protein S5]-alanine N-acetyltransferase
MIQTARLELMPCELAHFEALLRNRQELASLLKVTIPDSWPVFPQSMAGAYKWMKSDPSLHDWGTYLFIHAAERALIGEGGYKGQADASGMVEIGYAIIPEYRRRGLASEAAAGLTRYAFSHPHVKIVDAHTLPERNPSTRVLKKLGMQFVGIDHDPDEGEVWHWRLTREDYEKR